MVTADAILRRAGRIAGMVACLQPLAGSVHSPRPLSVDYQDLSASVPGSDDINLHA